MEERPQSRFVVHEGILNYRGTNTLAIALWAMEPNLKIVPRVSLAVRGWYDGGLKVAPVEAPSYAQLYP